jgi:hypothetical protein
MTQEIIGCRVHDALSAFETPAYPSHAIAARVAASGAPRARTRPRALSGAFTALALTLIAAGSAAFAVPSVLPDRTLRLLDSVGIHLRSRPILALDTRQVSLAEARSQADFPVLVPLGARIVRVLLSSDRRHHTFVSVVLQDGRGSQIQLEETRFDHRLGNAKPLPSYQIDSKARRVAPPGSWVAVGSFRAAKPNWARPATSGASRGLIVLQPSAASTHFGPKLVTKYGPAELTFFSITKITPIRWTLGSTSLVMAPYDATSRAFAERVRRGPFSSSESPR